MSVSVLDNSAAAAGGWPVSVPQRGSPTRRLLAAWDQVRRGWPGAQQRVVVRVEAAGRQLPIVRLIFPGGPRRALLLTGIHGDEPSGPHALWQFFAGGQAMALRRHWSFEVWPLLNPLGYDLGTRGRPGCADLNRDFSTPAVCAETQAALTTLIGNRIDLATGGTHPRWDVALSLHEDPDEACLYLYDTGCWERHCFAAAIEQSAAFLDRVEGMGIRVCARSLLDDDPNRGGILMGGQLDYPALEPTLFRCHAVGRMLILEAPGKLSFPVRVQLQLAALAHFLHGSAPPIGDTAPVRAVSTKGSAHEAAPP